MHPLNLVFKFWCTLTCFFLAGHQSVWADLSENKIEPTAKSETLKIHHVHQLLDQKIRASDVTIEGVVIADYQATNQLKGFFVQEEDKDKDQSPKTSEGIFVFCGVCSTDVKVGDLVRVTGDLGQHFSMAQISSTKLSQIDVLSSHQPLPKPTRLQLPIPISANDLPSAVDNIHHFFESYEGMLVTIDETLTVGQLDRLESYGEITLFHQNRQRIYSDKMQPSESGYLQHQIDERRRKIILDDDSFLKNAAYRDSHTIFYPQPGFALENYVRAGDVLKSLTGVLHWSYAYAGDSQSLAWRIRPIPEIYSYTFEQKNVRPKEPKMVEGNIQFAHFNLKEYFQTIDRKRLECGPWREQLCMGADSVDERKRQTQKLVSAICEMNVDVLSLNGIENSPFNESSSVLYKLAFAVNQKCGDYQIVNTGPIGSEVIASGFLYKPTAVNLVGEPAILKSRAFVTPNLSRYQKNQPAVAQSFRDRISSRIITVVINHLKAKDSPCGVGDDDWYTGQGACNLTRTMAVEEELRWLASNPTDVDSDYVLLTGLFNAFRYEDPIQTLKDQQYVDVVDRILGASAYDSNVNGAVGTLSYMMASASLFPYVSGASQWHINADESSLFDYNDGVMDLGEDADEAKALDPSLFSPGPYRSSHQDPTIIGITFPPAPQCHGSLATVYVHDGYIVGGDNHGEKYQGFLQGSHKNDVIVGTRFKDVIHAGSGNDVICAADGNDWVFGGAGRDVIYSEAGLDKVFGGSSNDSLFGGIGEDFLMGNQGNDILDGGAMSNILLGGDHIDGCQNGRSTACEDEFSYQ